MSRLFQSGSIAACLLLILFNSSLYAGEEPRSSIWLSYSEDQEEVQDALLEINAGIDEDNTLTFRAGGNRSLFGAETITTNQYFIGLSTFEFFPWSLDVGYEYWGRSNEIVIDTLSFSAHWNTDNWALGFNLDYREIDFFSRMFMAGQIKIETESIGYGPSLQYFTGNWSLGLSAMWYDYEKDPSRLNNLRALSLLGAKTWSQASALNDWYAGGQIQYDFGSWNMGMTYSHAVAAINQAMSDSVTVILGIDISKQTHLELEAGQVYGENDETTSFGRVGIGFDF